jgi:hypothetical protein
MSGITNIKDVPRGGMGTQEVIDVLLIAESDFTAATIDWPLRSDVSGTGEITTAIPLVGGTQLPMIKFAIQKGKAAAKKEAGAGPGYEVYNHDGLVGEMVGSSAAQWLSMDLLNNMPVVAIARYPDGKRRVFGSLRVPLQVLFEEMAGVDGATLKVEFKTTGRHNFMPPYLATGVAVTLKP